ncbi:hypothetical protein CXB51_018238 [Gossypium anomalum]|uniref:BHLH domain-containing protein n=1 Tax=Gossypium anomalum TaxID=47600 RepID=A0A8J5ZH70_9ROSI|nr:hypothetical protein CXB51_018238 [Gossypium anomalum]
MDIKNLSLSINTTLIPFFITQNQEKKKYQKIPMADFSAQSYRQPFPFLDIDPTMESLTQFAEINPQSFILDNSAFNFQTFFPLSINDSLFSNQASQGETMSGFIHNSNQSSVSAQPIFSAKTEVEEISNKRKALDISESSSGNSSSTSPENSGRGKRAKSNDKEMEKPKEVVHVRARRGQATDSHSLAERVRRGKINERLRCLQDIVPGCYKAMGMALMLDEIINYVQSLQNQVEFLSMKLTAASTYYDFNSESDAMERMQREKAEEAKELERLTREGYVGIGGVACFHSSSTYGPL